MILVTGASGFIGRHLVAALLADGRDVRALVRSDDAAARVPPGAAVVRGDLGDPDSLKGAAAGCELVYHLAGAYRGSAAEMQASHVAGTARLLRAVEPGTRFVYVSSTSVYGWSQQWPADDFSPPRPESAYGSAKLAAERLVLARTTGESVVVRPTITYGIGDERGMLARAYRLLRRGVRRFPGTGDNRIHLLHVDDLAAGLLTVGQKGEGVFLFAGPSATPTRELFGLLARGAGLEPPAFGLPAPVLRSLAVGADAAWRALGRGGEAPLSRHSVDVLTQDRAYAPKRAPEELGWEAAVTAEQGLPEVGEWLASQAHTSSVAVIAGNARRTGDLGFDWRGYVEDNDEGLGTVYERFALRDVIQAAVDRTGARSILHAPLFGMMGFPGLDAVFQAQDGMRVGLLDHVPERLDAVVRQWRELGLEPEPHLVESADPTTWPERLDRDYDLVFSFAALWWYDDPWTLLAAQARWADKAVLSCILNRNLFIRVRARWWHRELFTQLNLEALDPRAQLAAARGLGLEPVDTGLFDIPPFPDTSVPLAKVVTALLGRKPDADVEAQGPWRWSILPYLKGEQPDLEEKVAKYARLEPLFRPIAPAWAHHRYTLFAPPGLTPSSPTKRTPISSG